MATAEPTTEAGTVSGSDTTTSKEASHMSKAQGQFTIIDYTDADGVHRLKPRQDSDV